MYFHTVGGTGSDTTSTTNMYHKDRFHVPGEAGVAQSPFDGDLKTSEKGGHDFV